MQCRMATALQFTMQTLSTAKLGRANTASSTISEDDMPIHMEKEVKRWTHPCCIPVLSLRDFVKGSVAWGGRLEIPSTESSRMRQ